MEQILTTAALIAGGIFAVWILFTDPGGEDGKGGEMNTAMLGALLMIPVIILPLIGIVLFLPVLLGIIAVIALAYGAYLGLRWFLTREREEKEERREGEKGRLGKALGALRSMARNLFHSRSMGAVRERVSSATARTREAVKQTGKSLKERAQKGIQRVRETGRKLRSSDGEREGGVWRSVRDVFQTSRSRLTKKSSFSHAPVSSRGYTADEKSTLRHIREDGVQADDGPAEKHESPRQTSSVSYQTGAQKEEEKAKRLERWRGALKKEKQDPLAVMRPIGLRTRKKVNDIYQEKKRK